MAIKKFQNSGKIQSAVKTETLPDINTAKGKQIAKNIANRVISGEITLDQVPKKYYSYVQGEVQGAAPVTKAISDFGNKVVEEVAPYAIGAAFGPVGLLSSIAGEAVNGGVTGASKGSKDSGGDVIADEEKYPVGNTVSEFTNPGYLVAGPLAKAITAKNVLSTGTRLMNGETAKSLLNESVKEFSNSIKNAKFIPAQVKYYGPTMGKTYAAKTNPNLIDLDTGGRPEYDALAKKYGYSDGREMILSDKGDYNAEYKELIKDQIKRIQANPQYSGKTIVVSNASLLNPKSGIKFANTPAIPEKSIMATRNHERHPGETIEHGEEGGDSLNSKGTPLRTDNRFISEIEGNKAIPFEPAAPDYTKAATTYHLDSGVKPLSKPISKAEKLGYPKQMRNNYGLTEAQRKQVIAEANDFAKKYGYSEIEDSPEALQQIQDMYRRHNTFGRTISDPDEFDVSGHHFGEEHRGLTTNQRAEIAATEGYPYTGGQLNPQDRVFVTGSPSALDGYGASKQPTFAVRRRISLGHNPLKGRENAEFELGDGSREMKPNEVRTSSPMGGESHEIMLGTGELSAKPLISSTQLSGAFNKPVIENKPNGLQSQGFGLPAQGNSIIVYRKQGGIVKTI